MDSNKNDEPYLLKVDGEWLRFDDVSIRRIFSDGTLGPNILDEIEIDDNWMGMD